MLRNMFYKTYLSLNISVMLRDDGLINFTLRFCKESEKGICVPISIFSGRRQILSFSNFKIRNPDFFHLTGEVYRRRSVLQSSASTPIHNSRNHFYLHPGNILSISLYPPEKINLENPSISSFEKFSALVSH